MRLLNRLRDHFRPSPRQDHAWPEDTAWTANARSCDSFRLDAGFAVTTHVPGWMLAEDAPNGPPIAPPALPVFRGHVLTRDAVGREAELIRHFAQLPPMPEPARQRETAAFCSLGVDLVLRLPGADAILVDTFSGSNGAASDLLALLENEQAPPDLAYDNLDQGWALQILLQPGSVFVLDWNWEDPDGLKKARNLRLPRSTLAAQAREARARLQSLHKALVAALGRDLWVTPVRDLAQ